jgi:membrane protein YqaA with SNARE-associated domain
VKNSCVLTRKPPLLHYGVYMSVYTYGCSHGQIHDLAQRHFLLYLFVNQVFFPIPPDVLLVALVLGSNKRWFHFALICTLGSVCGGIAGYGIGYLLMESVGAKIITFYNAEEYFLKVMSWYAEWDFWIVFIAAFSPIPYKVFTISSGVFQTHLLGFVLASAIGRGLRFFIVAYLLFKIGPPMKIFIDKYFDLLCLLFVILLIGGFLLIKVL